MRLKGLAVASLVSVGLISCAPVSQQKLNQDLARIKTPQPADFFDRSSPVEIVKVDRLLLKKDSLNHHIPDDKEVAVKFSNRVYLKDLTTIGGIPVKVDDTVAFQHLPPLTLKGKLSTVLEQIAVLTGSYWSYENGVIVFSAYKTVSYFLPSISLARLEMIYNTGIEDDKEKINLSKFKDDLFDEVKEAIKVVIGGDYIEGKVEKLFEVKDEKAQENKAREEVSKTNSDKDTEKKLKSEYKTAQQTDNTTNSKTTMNTEAKSQNRKNGIQSPKVNARARGNKNLSKIETIPVIEDINAEEVSRRVEDTVKQIFTGKKDQGKHTERETVKLAENQSSQKTSEAQVITSTSQIEQSEKVQIARKVQNQDTKVAVSKEAGLIVVKVNRQTEKQVDKVVRKIVEENLKNLVVIDLYLLETSYSDVKELSAEILGLLRNNREETNLSFSNSAFSISYTGLSQNFLTGIAKGLDASALVNYVITKGKGKVLSSPKIIVLPNHVARIKSVTKIPYIEPQTISIGTTTAQQSYQIKGIDDGVSLTVVPSVIGNSNIYLSLGVVLNRYVGDKRVLAGNLGTFDLPIQSPRIYSSTVRVKAGDTILIGGIKKSQVSLNDRRIIGLIPEGSKYENSDSNLFIIVKTRLIRFEEKQGG